MDIKLLSSDIIPNANVGALNSNSLKMMVVVALPMQRRSEELLGRDTRPYAFTP